MEDLRSKTVGGAAWMIAMRATVNLLGVASTIVLARLLTPDDFGLVALAGSAYVFFSVLGQFGFDAALIQLKDPDRSYYDTAWTANVLVGLCVAGSMGVVARPAASFFADPRIEHIIYSFAVLSLAKGFENIGVVNFRKQLVFKGEFLYFVLPKVASVFFGVTAAFMLRSYWALVIGMIASQVTKLLYSHFAQPFRPRFSLTKFRSLFQFTRWVLGSHLLLYLAQHGIVLILGKLRNVGDVGLFGLARQIALLPSTELLAPINRVLFPSFSTIANDTARLKRVFYQVFGVTASVAVPSAFGILAIADVLVPVAFGPQWEGVSPVLSILGFMGAINAIRSLLGPLLLARGVPKAMTTSLAVYVPLLLPATYFLATRMGAVGVAYAMLISTLASVPILFSAAKREVGIELSEMLKQSWRPLIASVVMALGISELRGVLDFDEAPTLLDLAALVGFGILVFTVADFTLWALTGKPPGAERLGIDTVTGYVRRARNCP